MSLSFNHHSDLPLDKDPGTRFLPWLIAFMVYLAALSVVATSVMQSVSSRWERGVSDTLSVQLPPDSNAQTDEANLRAVLNILKSDPAVSTARAVARSQVLTLLEPWLGPRERLDGLPIPHLIDVSLKPNSVVNGEKIMADLSKISSGISIDDHRIWLDRLLRMSQTLEAGAYIVLILIFIAATGTVFFVTKTGLAIHSDVIEVLHLIGAQDSYIARQFGEHALHLGLKGGFYGLAVSGPTFGLFAYLYRQIDSALLPQIDITLIQWILVLSLPVLSALMGYFTARIAVMRTLARMV